MRVFSTSITTAAQRLHLPAAPIAASNAPRLADFSPDLTQQGSTVQAHESVYGLLFPHTGDPAAAANAVRTLPDRAPPTRLQQVVDQVPAAHHPRPFTCAQRPPALQVGAARIPAAYEIRAFWEDAAVDHGSTREGSLRYRYPALEPTPSAAPAMCSRSARGCAKTSWPVHRAVTVIPNAADVEGFQLAQRSDPPPQARGLQGRTVLGFIGRFTRRGWIAGRGHEPGAPAASDLRPPAVVGHRQAAPQSAGARC